MHRLAGTYQRPAPTKCLIPICILTLNSEVGEKHPRTQPFFVIGQLGEGLTQHLNQLIQGRKNPIVKLFLAQFLPQVFDRIDFWTIGRLKDQAHIRLPPADLWLGASQLARLA